MATSISAADIERLAKRIADLDRQSQHLRVWLYIWTALVAIGLTLEYRKEFVRLAELLWVYVVERVPFESWRIRKTLTAIIAGALVTVGVVGELWIEFSQSDVETELAADNGKLTGDLGLVATQALRDAGAAMDKLVPIGSQAKAADEASKRALETSNRSEGTASGAMTLARGARQEADTFEKRLGSAEHKADEAESHVDEALRRAVEATTALDRIRLPRSLTKIPELATTLKPFKDTEYTFASVSTDDESRELLKQIDGMLQLAGWKRVKQSAIRLGIPAFQVFGPNDLVEMGAYTGIQISVDSSETLENLQKLPIESLPPLIRLSILLNNGIFSNLSPPEDAKDLNRVDIGSGTSTVIRINVGKKP
jgi:hypothetical protein